MSAPASWAKVSANTAHANQQRGPQDYYPNQRMQNTLNTNINNNFNGFPGSGNMGQSMGSMNMNVNANNPNVIKNEESSNINKNNVNDNVVVNDNNVVNENNVNDNKDESHVNPNNDTMNDIVNMDNNISNVDTNNNDNNNDISPSNNNVEQKQRKSPTNQQTSNANLMFHGSKYEIKCDETFAYYEGYIIDYDVNEKKLSVLYDWKPPQKVPLDYVRKVAPAIDRQKWKPRTSDKVECKAKAEESEPFGWWGCKISTVRDNLYLITYEGWENHHEVLHSHMLRPYNPNKPLSTNLRIERKESEIEPPIDTYRRDINDLPQISKSGREYMEEKKKFLEWLQNAKTHDELQNVKNKTGLIHLGYNPIKNKLLYIGTKKQIIFAYKLLSYLWDLKRKYDQKELDQKNAEIDLKKEYDELKQCYQLKFKFDERLTKYVIGSRGENVKRAKKIDGVKHVNIKDGECLVLAEDKDSAEEAKDLLEIVMETIDVPRQCVKEIIGVEGKNVIELEKMTHVSSISTMKRFQKTFQNNDNNNNDERFQDCDENSGLARMVIIGPKQNVASAKHQIDLQVNQIKSRNDYNKQIKDINSQLGLSRRRRMRMNSNNSNNDMNNDMNNSNSDIKRYNYANKPRNNNRYNNDINNDNDNDIVNDEAKQYSNEMNDDNENNWASLQEQDTNNNDNNNDWGQPIDSNNFAHGGNDVNEFDDEYRYGSNRRGRGRGYNNSRSRGRGRGRGRGGYIRDRQQNNRGNLRYVRKVKPTNNNNNNNNSNNNDNNINTNNDDNSNTMDQ